ncbi:MAG: YjbQ family protein [Promethearchaeota archaeon]
MFEKLYCPDFSAIFNEKFSNPFIYPMLDTLQWPLLIDIDMPAEAKNLLDLKDERGHSLFYRRKISSKEWGIERECASIGHVLFQAYFLDLSHKISNSQVIAACQKVFPRASAIVCPELSGFDIDFIKNNEKYISGIVFYPFNQDIEGSEDEIDKVIKFCNDDGYPVKWDVHGLITAKKKALQEVIAWILSKLEKFKKVIFILSGLELPDLIEVSSFMKYNHRLWLEIDPRVIGGTNPGTFFKELFSLPGFIQNFWDRIIIGTSTPMLEASQVTRGIWEATEPLPFNLKALLRTWLQRNALRIFKVPLGQVSQNKAFLEVERFVLKESNRMIQDLGDRRHAIVDFELTATSFSITQLLWIQPLVKQAWERIKSEFKEIEAGELLIRSYHTTTSILINEHERGNFLQLHYDFCLKTQEDPSFKLHTVAAEENRADFNFPDHILASSIGNRNVIVPISKNKLDMGGRENIYIIVTFGPRNVKIKFRFSIYQKK